MIEQLTPSPWEVHPALVHFPIAFLLGGVALDLFAWWRLRRQENPTEVAPELRALTQFATGLLIAGVLAGVPAVLTGFIAYVTAPLYVADTNILWHLSVSLSSLTLFAWVAFMRWLDWASSPTFVARITGLVAAVLLAAGAALGGHLVYRGGAAGFNPGLTRPPAASSAVTGQRRPMAFGRSVVYRERKTDGAIEMARLDGSAGADRWRGHRHLVWVQPGLV